MMKHSRYDFISITFLYVFSVIVVVLLSSFTIPNSSSRLGIIAKESKREEIISFFNVSSFEGLSLKAKAYIVYDIVDEKIISAKNENDVLPLASVTKIMTAITARIHNDKSAIIKITPDDIEGSYDLGLIKNQTWKLEELLKYTLVFSSNDGAEAIANSFGGKIPFVEQMNIDATLLGLPLHFNDPAGLDIDGKLGGEGSALSVAKLFAVARKRFPEILDATIRARATVVASTGKLTGVPNTNQDIAQFFGVEASKTGFTDIAGGNLAIVVDITVGHPVVIVVLGSTHTERFTDVDKLYKALKESLEEGVK